MEINLKLVNSSLPKNQLLIVQSCGVRRYCPNQIGICWRSTCFVLPVFKDLAISFLNREIKN